MSLAEVKEQIEQMSPAERDELAFFLRAKRLIDSPDYRAKIVRADQQIDAGNFVTAVQLEELAAKNRAARGAS